MTDDTDIVTRLHAAAQLFVEFGDTSLTLPREAANEIERLTAAHDDYVVRVNANVCELNREIERLTAALDACADYGDKQVAEIERLRGALETCRELRRGDAAMLQMYMARVGGKP